MAFASAGRSWCVVTGPATFIGSGMTFLPFAFALLMKPPNPRSASNLPVRAWIGDLRHLLSQLDRLEDLDDDRVDGAGAGAVAGGGLQDANGRPHKASRARGTHGREP